MDLKQTKAAVEAMLFAHADVYKRQDHRPQNGHHQRRGRVHLGQCGTGRYGPAAVSYTHLDVYKRQVTARAGDVFPLGEGTLTVLGDGVAAENLKMCIRDRGI